MALRLERAIRRRSRRHHRSHPGRAAAPERSGGGFERRSGCRHIVDEEQSGAAHVVETREGANHVSPAGFARQRHLGSRITVTDQMLIQHGHGQPSRQLSRDERALVEAALPLARGTQWNWNERVDIRRAGQRFRRNSCQRPGEVSLVTKLQAQNRIPHGRLVRIAHIHLVDAPFLVQTRGALVAVFQPPVALAAAGTRKGFELRNADGANAVTERATPGADRWEDDVRKAASESSGRLANWTQGRGA